MPSDTMPSAASSRTGWAGSGGCGPLTWRVRAADGLLWCGRHSVANSITAIPALIAAWLAETGLSPEVRGPMAAPATGCRRLGGTVPLTIVCGVYVLCLFTVSMSGCGRSVCGRFGCRGPSDPGDRDVVDEPGDECHDDCPSESVILQDRGHDAAPALAGLVLNAAAGWWWADPLAALVIVVYALREAREIFLGGH